ncbi:hypothetical protein D3C75_402720 [compost metagenome]
MKNKELLVHKEGMEMILTVDQMVRIAHAGGGLDLSGKILTVDQIVRIAHAASTHKATIIVPASDFILTVDQMVRIAHAGKGSVIFR